MLYERKESAKANRAWGIADARKVIADRDRERQRDRETERERESVCVCVCARAHNTSALEVALYRALEFKQIHCKRERCFQANEQRLGT